MGIGGEYDPWIPVGILASGVSLTLLAGGEGLFRVTNELSVTGTFLAGLATSLPFTLLLIAGGYWLRQSAIPPRFYTRIGAWCLVSGVSFTALIGVFAPLIFDSTAGYLGVFRWALAIGAGGGFLIGTFNVRMIQRMLDAERASVRAEEAEQRREFLEYLNALLRHEVLNTANVIDGQAALLDDEVSSDRPAIIRRQATDLTGIIDDVRFLVTASDETNTTRRVDLADVLRTELHRLADRYDSVAIDAEVPQTVIVPADDLLNRLFRNLLENAVEHDTDGARVRLRVRPDDAAVTVEISDDGPGLPADLRSDLFDPAVSRRDGKSRLGTVIVGRLVDRYYGRVAVADTGPEGTTVEVTLPLVEATEIDGSAAGAEATQAAD